MEGRKVYISYAKEDREVAERLYKDLMMYNIQPWIDTRNLKPGQNWKEEISKAIKESSVFLALFSSSSVSKAEGFVQNEWKMALEELDKRSTADIYLIPIRIDDCIPYDEKLKYLHWIDLFPSYEEGLERIVRIIRTIS